MAAPFGLGGALGLSWTIIEGVLDRTGIYIRLGRVWDGLVSVPLGLRGALG